MDKYQVTESGDRAVFSTEANALAYARFLQARFKAQPLLCAPDGKVWDFSSDEWVDPDGA